MNNKNIVLLKITAFLIILVLLLSSVSFANTMNDITENATETVKSYGSLNLVTGEMKTTTVKLNNSRIRSYSEKDTRGYFPVEFNQLIGPQNQNDTNSLLIPNVDRRKPIPNQERNL